MILGLSYRLGNLGDYMQQYMIEEKFGVADVRIDRDDLPHFVPETNIDLVLNCYLDSLKPLHERINVTFYSVHFTKSLREKVSKNSEMIDWLRNFNIGCRDSGTAKFLTSIGVSNHRKDCITLSLAKRKDNDGSILLIDTKKDLNGISLSNVVRNESYEAMVTKAKERIAVISKAKKVYTSRLHVALPCIAMGVPFEFIHFNPTDDRFDLINEKTNEKITY